jgi:hypothetical protein
VLEWLAPCQIPAHPRVASRGVPQYESPASAASVCSETAPPYPKPHATPRDQRSRSVGDSSRGHRLYPRSWATRRHDVDSARFRHLTRSNYTTHAAASRASFRQIRMLSVVEDLARRRRIRPLDLRILGIRRVRRANLTTGTALFHSDSGEISDVSQLLSIEALAGTQDHADILTGDQGSNVLYGAFDPSQGYVDGGDSLNGVSGDDQLYGLTGNDELNGGDGDDSVVGGRGKDRLDGGLGVNSNDGGRGIDFCVNPDTAGGAVNCEGP